MINMTRVRWQPWVVGLVLGVLSSAASSAAPTYTLTAGGKPGDTARVEVLLEVGGDLKLVDDGKVKQLPMSVVGKLRFQEHFVDARPSGGGRARSLRRYERAEAVIKIEKETLSTGLRDDRRLIAAAADVATTLHSPQGPLTRDELDLIEVPCDSLLIDQLLPDKPVVLGERWSHSEALLAGLLGLDAVSQSDVASELSSVDAQAAQIALMGKLTGAAEGVATQIELAGKYRFDLSARRVTRLAVSIKENRSVGHVAAGLDIVAKLQMHVTPVGQIAELSDEAAQSMPLEPAAGSLGLEDLDLEYQPAIGKYAVAYDRRWHIVSDRDDVLAMRMVDRGDLIAQCNLTALPDVEPEKHPTLARFQQDIERTLGKDFGQFVRAAQSVNEAGYACYRVEAEGLVAELPIRWNYYLLADDRGHVAVFVFTVEGALVEQLGDADLAMVETLRFKN
jgi:hypothetical protein